MSDPREGSAAIVPVFVFSLPRSGSTLLQRMLATHPAIETASEPWILLPFLYALRRKGVYAEYGHRTSIRALEDFASGLPGGERQYIEAVRDLALRLYRERAGAGAQYFVDKTPRYHVIAGDILRMFEDARFIFLWRNPLAIVASMIEGWGRGHWNLYEFEVDLHDGLEALVDAQWAAGERAISVRFAELVDASPDSRDRIFSFLGLEMTDADPERQIEVHLDGRMGDQTGVRQYNRLSQEPRIKWMKTLGSPLRKAWCRRYLRWIGPERLHAMGYELDELLRELEAIPTSWRTVPSDALRMFAGRFVRAFEPWILRDKLDDLRHGHRLHPHS
jgi:hypothetical protein